jgi:hypothetical protein
VVPLAADIEQDREEIHPFGDPAPSPPGFLAASSIHTTDASGTSHPSERPHPFDYMRGPELSGGQTAAVSRNGRTLGGVTFDEHSHTHPTEGMGLVDPQAGRPAGSPVDLTPYRRSATLRGNVRVAVAPLAPTSLVPMRGAFTMRGQLIQHSTHTTTFKTRHSTLNTRHSTLDIRHSTLNTQHSTPNTQHSTLNTRYLTLDTGHSTLNPQPSTPNTRHSTLNSQHSTLNTQHSTLDTQHSGELIHAFISYRVAAEGMGTQGQILGQSPTDATRFWWHLYGS